MYNAKNHMQQGGEVFVVGGTIVNGDGELLIANQAASTATDVAGLKADLSALIAKLKAAGLMVADA
ncbi:MAG: hypothetical protein K0S76_436 [Herbinix sp.]|jgi:hypothetical protein|nr:hypothetical protein [Herbinix sp.]